MIFSLHQVVFIIRFETSDGTKRQEEGELKDKDTEDEATEVKGSFSYMGADGVLYTVKYVADDNGFHPEGDHFKVPAYVPWLKGQPHDDGQYKHDKNDDGSISITPKSSYKATTEEPEVTGSRILSPLREPPIKYIPSTSNKETAVLKPNNQYIPIDTSTPSLQKNSPLDQRTQNKIAKILSDNAITADSVNSLV